MCMAQSPRSKVVSWWEWVIAHAPPSDDNFKHWRIITAVCSIFSRRTSASLACSYDDNCSTHLQAEGGGRGEHTHLPTPTTHHRTLSPSVCSPVWWPRPPVRPRAQSSTHTIQVTTGGHVNEEKKKTSKTKTENKSRNQETKREKGEQKHESNKKITEHVKKRGRDTNRGVRGDDVLVHCIVHVFPGIKG